jgi:hypothetical protein
LIGFSGEAKEEEKQTNSHVLNDLDSNNIKVNLRDTTDR